MEIKESVVAITGIVGFSVVALVVATKQAPVPRIGDGSGSFLFQEPEQEHSEAGAPPLELPPHAVEDVETSLLQAESPASGAGLHLSPAGANPQTGSAASFDQAVPAGVPLTSPDFAPSRERFLEMSVAIYRALDLALDEIEDVDHELWERFPEYAYLLNRPGWDMVRGYFPHLEDPRKALEIAWEDPANRVLFERHMQLYRQTFVGMQGGMDTSTTQRQLDELRDALWSSISPAHQFLYRLDQETQ